MKYISTRGEAKKLGFDEVLLAGLAGDGGLYVPEFFPQLSEEQIKSMAGKSYEDIAYQVIAPFVGGSVIDEEVLKRLIKAAYANFNNVCRAPLKQIGNNEFILELFHGPTLAFKDFALQLLGKMLDYILQKNGRKVVIVGATSGDTGSAAIYGCQDCRNVEIFVMHPHERVSAVQRRQMTTLEKDNVHNIAIEGDFDDCQHLLKQLFKNQQFLSENYSLVAVNSINWARIMAQIVYYFYSAVQLGAPERSISYVVPTGNFGDVYAGYVAKKMGLNIKQLVVATNSNDILHRFFENNEYRKQDKVKRTLSPSMDIQVSSNFERLLFDAYDGNAKAVSDIMQGFQEENRPIEIGQVQYEKIKAVFASFSASDTDTLAVIKYIYTDTGEVVDPHTATALAAMEHYHKDKNAVFVALATAHPAKFADAIKQAGVVTPELPEFLSHIMTKKEKFTVLANDISGLQEFIVKNLVI